MPGYDISIDLHALNADKAASAIDQVTRSASQAEKALGGIGAESAKAASQTVELGRRGKDAGEAITTAMKGAAKSVLALVGAYKAVEGMKGFVQRGIEFNSSVESSRIGMASIITSMVQLEDAQGKVLEGAKKYQAAQGIAADMMKEIQRLGLETTATTQELVEGVQTIMGPAVQAGMALKDIPKFAVAGAQAMQTLGIPLNQMRTELDAILTGTVNKAQDILAPKLFADVKGDLGEYIRGLKEAGTLIPELNKRLEPFALAGKDVAQTWKGLTSNLSEALDVLAGNSAQGITKNLKKAIAVMRDFILITENGQTRISDNLENIAEFLTLLENRIGGAILGSVEALVDGFKAINDAIGPDSHDAIESLAVATKTATAAMLGLAVAQKAATAVENWNQYKASLVEASRAEALKARESLNAARATVQAMREEQAFIKQRIASAEATKKSSSRTRELATLRQELAVVTGELNLAESKYAAAQAASKTAGDKFLSLKNGVSNLAAAGNKLKAAFSSLLGFFGGPWGVALTVAAAGVGYLASRQTEAERVSEKYSEAYAKASKELVAVKDAANTAAEGVNNLTQAQARVKLEAVKEEINSLIEEMSKNFSFSFKGILNGLKINEEDFRPLLNEFGKFFQSVKKGTPDIAGFVAKMDELSSINPKLAAEFQSYAIALKILLDVQKEQQGIIDRTSTKQKEHTDSVRQTEQASKELEAVQKALNEIGQKEIKTKADAIKWLAKRYNATKQGKEALEAEAKATDESALATLRLASAQALARAMAAGLIASQAGATQAQIDNAQKLFAEYSNIAGFIARIEANKGKFGENVSGGGTSSIDNARQSVERLKDEIAQLNGTAGKTGTDLKKKLAEIEKLGKAAKLSAGEIQRLKTDYTDAFRTNTLNEFNKEVLKLEDNTGALRKIEIAETVKEWEQRFAAADLSAKQAAPHMERLKKALAEQEDFKDLNVAADFYKELGELSGEYGKDIEYQNRLIEKQAKAWRQAGIPLADIQKRVELMRLKMSTDPFDGAYRGLLKFTAEYSDAGKQWEDITHGFASDFNSATRNMFDDFLDTGRMSFDDLGRLFKRLLRDMAYQALIQPVVLSVVNGAAGALYGSTTAGGAGGAAAAGTGMGYAGSVIQLGAQAAQGYAVNQLMSGSGGMFGGIANSINSGVAGMFPTLFAPSATSTVVFNPYTVEGMGVVMDAPSTLPTFTEALSSSFGPGALGAGLGSIASPYVNNLLGLKNNTGSQIGSTIGGLGTTAVLGTLAMTNIWNPGGWVLGGLAALGSLFGGGIGSLFGGGAEDGPPTYDWTLRQKLWEKGPEEDAPWVFDGYRGSSKGAEGDAYRVGSWGKWGIPDQLRQQGAEYAYGIMKGVSEQSWALADALGKVSGSMRDEYLLGLERQGELYHYGRWRGGNISEENLQKSAEAYTQKATEHMANALGGVNLRPLTIAADGMAADTVDELGQSLTQAFSFFDIGETFKDEKVKARFQAQARKQIVDAFADLDFSFLRVDFDKSSFAGLQRAYAAVQAWDTVTAGLEAILNPLSELSTQLNTATTQFDGWIANLRDLGWQEEAIAEIEQRRAQYLHEYATAVTRAGEQDLALRALALELGSDSDAYGIRSLQYKQENELAQLAKQYGRDSGLYSTAVEIQQAELAQTRVTQLEKELEKALAAERQAAQAATQNQTTALNNQASALRDSAREAERMRDAFADIVDALLRARRDIWASGDDNLLGSSYRESMAAFEDAYARGMAGDQDALRELPGLADSLLASGRKSLATYEQYNDLYYAVDQKLKAAQARAQSGYDAQAAIADSLNAQLDAITAQTDALQKAINAGTAAGEYTGRSVDAIRAELELMRAVLAKEKADVAGDTSAGGASLSQREALLWAKSDRLNAQAYMGRTDWTPASTLAEIYRNNLTLESWYDRYGRYEGLGVEYDTAAARQSIMANKAALLNSQAYQGRTDWIEQDVAAAIANAGMTKDDWYLRHGLGEGVQSGYKAYTGNALYDYDQLLRDKAADLSAEGYLGIAHWTALDVAAEIANQGMTVPQWYELYGKQEGYALKAAATTNKTVEKGLSSVSGAMNKQLASSQALGSIMSGVGSSVSGYMQAVQSGMSGLSSSISRLNLNVTVNVTGGSSSTSSSGTSGASGASGAAPVVDPFARLSSATGVFGSHYQSEYALLTAKARRMMDDGEFDNLPDGYTSWTAAAVAQAIKDAGLSGTKEWYEKHGKVEGFATGGITPADEVFWVGENGPELMMSPRRWGVLSNADSMSLLDSRGAPPVYAVMGKDNREIVAELREIKGYLRQVVTKTDKTAYCADRINGLLRMWDAEGLPATSAA